MLAVLSQSDVIFAGLLILGVFLALFLLFFVGVWMRRNAVGKSPYTGTPLRRASELNYLSSKRILQFLYDKHEYDNRIIDLQKAAFCRETGRIFPDCVTWFETVNVDWTFLNKRFPGNYVSWGSLTDIQQTLIRESHFTLEGFQTEHSCRHPSPREITPEFIFLKPGPLYVDLNSKVLLGWQNVPESEFEVLIVQRPKPRPW